MSAHLGSKVSALLDDQLGAAESDACWAHVHACHACRDLVERESWIKRRVSGLCHDPAGHAPDALKGSLLRAGAGEGPLPWADTDGPWSWAAAGALPDHLVGGPRARRVGMLVGGGALGVAMVGVLALAGPASAPTQQRQVPTASISSPSGSPSSPVRPASASTRP